MSQVSNVVLLQASYFGNWEKERLPMINRHLEEQGVGSLVSVEDEEIRRRNAEGNELIWYGGSKYLECNIAIAAFNRLDVDAFLKFLREGVPWGENDGQCLLILKDELDFKFQIHEIFEGEI